MTVRPRNPSSRSSSETSPSSSTPFSWAHIDDLTSNGDDDGSTVSTWHEEAHWMSFRLAVQQFASVKLGTSVIQEEEEEEETEDEKPRAACPTNNAETTDVLTDLAETKMRLALAQAERDELEFTLLQRQSPRATST